MTYKTQRTPHGLMVELYPNEREEDFSRYFKVELLRWNDGFVYWKDESGETHQLCKRMAQSGKTLSYPSDEAMIKGIKRELRKWKQDQLLEYGK